MRKNENHNLKRTRCFSDWLLRYAKMKIWLGKKKSMMFKFRLLYSSLIPYFYLLLYGAQLIMISIYRKNMEKDLLKTHTITILTMRKQNLVMMQIVKLIA